MEWCVLPAEQARVVLIDEEREMRTQCAAFVAKPLGERRMRADERLERLPQRHRIERDVTGAARETAEGAVQQHSHMGTTNRVWYFRHSPAITLPDEAWIVELG